WLPEGRGASTNVTSSFGRVAELADAQDSGSCVRKDVGVQVPPRPPHGLHRRPCSFSHKAVSLSRITPCAVFRRDPPPADACCHALIKTSVAVTALKETSSPGRLVVVGDAD